MIEKTITIDEKEVKLKTSGGLPRRYREMFQRDVFLDFGLLTKGLKKNKSVDASDLPVETMEIVENLAFCMAKFADPDIPDDIYEWLDQFSSASIYLVANEIIMLWNEEQKTTSQPKKQSQPSTEK